MAIRRTATKTKTQALNPMQKILVANRGEIACRVIRSAEDLGLATVAVYSEADAEALHVKMADESRAIGPAKAQESYLNVERILQAAEDTGADAIHPGYGFLAENAAFARDVEGRGLTWVGPRPAEIELMGDKERAKLAAAENRVPTLPGSKRIDVADDADLEAAARGVGFPLLVKACAGGGGIGMRRVDGVDELAKIVEATQTMAERSFGDGSVFLERYIPKARHVEVQVFGFGDGRAIHLFERDCSIQRRFQKSSRNRPRLDYRPRCARRWRMWRSILRPNSVTAAPGRSSSWSTPIPSSFSFWK